MSAAAEGSGQAQRLDDVAEDRLAPQAVLGRADPQMRGLQRVAGAFVQWPPLGDLHYRAQQRELAGGRDRRVQRVQADPGAAHAVRVQADRGHAQGLGDQVPLADAVLALGVQDHDLPVLEAELAQDVRLLQRRLAVPGLAEHQPVRGRELLAVELEGVVDVALAGVDLAADDHAGVAQARGGRGQVDRLRLGRGGPHRRPGRLDLAEQQGREAVDQQVERGAVGRHESGPFVGYLRSPVANGSVLANARWCSRSHHSSFRNALPAEARMVRLSRASGSGPREETVM